MIVLDTSVLSLAYRRPGRSGEQPPTVAALARLIADDVPIAVPGIVLQEVLSGVRSDDQFAKLQRLLDGFPVLVATKVHHVAAARIANSCRANGIAAATIDCLVASLTIAAGARLFTLDRDFAAMAPHCGLDLYPAVA